MFNLILCIIAKESELKEKLLLNKDLLKKRSLENEKLQSSLKSKAGIVVKQFPIQACTHANIYYNTRIYSLLFYLEAIAENMKEINELQEKISQFSEENTSQHLKS